ncbi:MAG: bifunctional phosphopantothenoylcysteine decarboxylase/phosphopantothenate--cysteine ligase CoaBC [Acidimicrobiia bacterium]
MLSGRRILLGVSGGVAAYKSIYLARRLTEREAEVRVILTRSARRFVGAQSFAAVTGHYPYVGLFGPRVVSPHTELASWADALVIAPATAHTLAKLAHGLSSDLLSATFLATRAPVLIAPAMHTEMWEQPATQRNLATLVADGHHTVGPGIGALAGGDEGEGRVSEPEEIIAALEGILAGSLSGWKVLVTTGGTREPIDPVRFIGNRSSGRMGREIAAEAARRGADVVLVSSAEVVPASGVETVLVETAEEMAAEVWSRSPSQDVVIMAAAVADFRPKAQQEVKYRREAGPPDILLEPTPDVLAGVREQAPDVFLVGFAAETGPAEGAVSKARTKGVQLLVANDVTSEGSGFGTATNQVTLIDPDGSIEPWPLLPKSEVARRLWDRIAALRSA